MKNLIVVVGLLLSSTGCIKSPEAIFHLVDKSEFILTPVLKPNRGGTGFVVRAPNGKVYTITNAHVCGLAKDRLEAQIDGKVKQILDIIKVSDKTDLCALSAPVGVKPLDLADEGMSPGRPYYKVGHASLEPSNMTMGFLISRHPIKVLDDADISECKGPKYTIETWDAVFGLSAQMCVATIDAQMTTIPTKPGDSGSPVVDENGDVVAVVFAGDQTTYWGALIPFDSLVKFLKEL